MFKLEKSEQLGSSGKPGDLLPALLSAVLMAGLRAAPSTSRNSPVRERLLARVDGLA